MPAPAILSIGADDLDDAGVEAAAAFVRVEWGLGGGPIDNVVRLLESKGVVVIRPVIGTTDIDAFSTSVAGRPLVVLSSDKGDAARSRFDAAHELGHLVMHHDAAPGLQALERQAQRFAAALLMLADVIRAELPTRMSWPKYFDLKTRWRVSVQALLYRARTVRVLSPDAYQRAQIQFTRYFGRETEPVDLGPPEEPILLRKALDLMDTRLGIKKAAIAEEARFPLRYLDDLLADAVPPAESRPEVPVA